MLDYPTQYPPRDPQQFLPQHPDEAWVDQFAQHLLLTAQALQRLHEAFDRKFTR